MIISASRRTDIPAFFSDWFLQHLKEGSVEVKNPFNPSVRKIVSLKEQDVSAFVFWTRNPLPFFPCLDYLDKKGIPYYFLITINNYPKFLEPGVPDLEKTEIFLKRLSERIGSSRIIWRYDPIIISEELSVKYHKQCFSKLIKMIHPFSQQVIISFVDLYKKVETRFKKNGFQVSDIQEKSAEAEELMDYFQTLTGKYRLEWQSCAQDFHNLTVSVKTGKCIDEALLNRLFNLNLIYQKDRNQRKLCGCHRSIDIGAYGTCPRHCLYCYAYN